MISAEEYYTAPPQEVFEDVKENCIKIWKTYDDTYGYATGKIDRIKDLPNVSDNAYYMAAMFDHWNQEKLIEMVKPITKVFLLRVISL